MQEINICMCVSGPVHLGLQFYFRLGNRGTASSDGARATRTREGEGKDDPMPRQWDTGTRILVAGVSDGDWIELLPNVLRLQALDWILEGGGGRL